MFEVWKLPIHTQKDDEHRAETVAQGAVRNRTASAAILPEWTRYRT